VTDPTDTGGATIDGARGYDSGDANDNWMGTKELRRYLWNKNDGFVG
jgi:hypothetical protein